MPNKVIDTIKQHKGKLASAVALTAGLGALGYHLKQGMDEGKSPVDVLKNDLKSAKDQISNLVNNVGDNTDGKGLLNDNKSGLNAVKPSSTDKNSLEEFNKKVVNAHNWKEQAERIGKSLSAERIRDAYEKSLSNIAKDYTDGKISESDYNKKIAELAKWREQASSLGKALSSDKVDDAYNKTIAKILKNYKNNK